MTASITKFLFDREFKDEKEIPFSDVPDPFGSDEHPMDDAEAEAELLDVIPAPEPEAPPPPPTFSEEELEQAKTEAFQAGQDQAAREALLATETKAAETLDRIAEKMDSLLEDAHSARGTATSDAIALAGAIVRKMLPASDPVLAAGEILHVIEATMGRLFEEPTVVVRINPALMEFLEDKITAISERNGYQGRLTINADPALPVGDCRIEWGVGGVERDLSALWAEVDDIIKRNTGVDIAALSETPPPSPAATTDAPAPSDDAPLTADVTASDPGETADPSPGEPHG